MAHQLTVREDGKVEFFAGSNQPAWHGLGTVVQGTVSANDALKLANLDWHVEGKNIYTWSDQWNKVENYMAVTRNDNNQILGVVTNNYQLVQNWELANLAESLFEEGSLLFDTAGSLYGGKKIFFLLKVPGSHYIMDDEITRYVLVTSGHDGMSNITFCHVPVRVVCANTLAVAMKGATNVVKFKHTKGYVGRMDLVRQMLSLAERHQTELEMAMADLQNQPFNRDGAQLNAFVNALLPNNRDSDSKPQTILKTLFHEGNGTKGETMYDAFNAAVEYADHYTRTKTPDHRFSSQIEGRAVEFKSKALSLLQN